MHSCALHAGGDLHCWGNDYAAQLGDGTTSGRSTLVASVGGFHDWTEVSAGSERTCAIRGTAADGKLYCWGESSYGAIGDGTGQRYQPVTVVLGT